MQLQTRPTFWKLTTVVKLVGYPNTLSIMLQCMTIGDEIFSGFFHWTGYIEESINDTSFDFICLAIKTLTQVEVMPRLGTWLFKQIQEFITQFTNNRIGIWHFWWLLNKENMTTILDTIPVLASWSPTWIQVVVGLLFNQSSSESPFKLHH